MQDNFNITSRTEGGAFIIGMSGEVDVSTVGQLEQIMKPMTGKHPLWIIVECSNLRFLHSRAIGLLIQFHRHASSNGGACLFVGMPENLGSRLAVFMALDKFESEPDVASALKKIAALRSIPPLH